jgi:hypothetical protein
MAERPWEVVKKEGLPQGSPAAGLVEALCHKVCREVVLHALLILEGVVHLSVRHGPALKPAVEHLHAANTISPLPGNRDGL